jgi:LPXTG-site transpeptidase (sortase) family protein
MDVPATIIARLIRAGVRAYERKWSFLALFALAFGSSTALLASYDLLPEPQRADAAPVPAAATPVVTSGARVQAPEAPVRITIPAIKLSATVANPVATDIPSLDHLLLAGAVRYPGSARLNEEGNMVLFGHSSYLPVVNNPAMRTYNTIQKLRPGDRITVVSASASYTYVVRSVEKAAASEAVVPLHVAGHVLTLVTCNSFASKDDRFVVTADLLAAGA